MLIIKTFTVSHFEQKARVIIDTVTKKACIIDPGADIERLYEATEPDINILESIFLTHCHIDHAGGVKPLLDLLLSKIVTPCPHYYHSEDKVLARSIEFSCKQYGLPSHYFNVPTPTEYLDNKDFFSIGNIKGSCLFTPGHAPGHVALYFEKQTIRLIENNKTQDIDSPLLIAGDALFRGSIGRTDLPFGDHATLIKSIKEKLFTLPEDTVVLSGHGPNTLIGLEKQTNPFFN
jgi:hydroxyacylglutathione hydrolase